jgi:hypothetical protein
MEGDGTFDWKFWLLVALLIIIGIVVMLMAWGTLPRTSTDNTPTT